MSMDGAILPINFYCRNARLCLKKAALSKKSHLYADEVQHLKAFEALVLSTIPGHPLYTERREEKHILELRLHLHDARKRITELEENRAADRQAFEPNVKGPNPTHNSPAGQKNGENTSIPSSKLQGNATPEKLQGSRSKSQESTPFRPHRTGAITPARSQQPQRNIESTTPVKVETSNPRTRSQRSGIRSADNTPLKKQRKGSPRRTSPRIASDFRASLANSHNKIRRLQQNQQRQRSDLPREGGGQQQESAIHPKMQDAYAFASKSTPIAPRSKSTPILQRLRNVSQCLGGENPRRAKEKDKTAMAKATSLSREGSPFHGKTPREMPRLKALGLVSSIAGGKTSSLKATIHLPTRFDNCLSPGQDQQLGSEDDEPDFSHNLSSEERLPSPESAQISASPGKDLPKLGSCPHRTSPARYPAHSKPEEARERREQSPEPNFDPTDSQDIAERGGGGRLRELEDEAESMRRDEAAWTTFRLQEQFGEALKELGSLQDRGEEVGLGAIAEKCILHSSASKQIYSNGASPQPRHGGRGEKMHVWKLGAHAKGERLHEIEEEEEAYFQRGGGGYTGNADQSGRDSPVKSSRKKNGKPGNGESKVHYGEHTDHLELFTAPHSKEGSDNSGGNEDSLRGVKEDCQRFREQIKALRDTRSRDLSPEMTAKKRTPPRFQDQGQGGGMIRERSRVKKRGARDCKAEGGGGGDMRRGGPEFGDLSGGGSEIEEQREDQIPARDGRRHPNAERRVGEGRGGHSKNKFKARTSGSALPISPFSLSSASTSPSSTSSSSLSSLPLSHYIQKLKHLGPESKFPSSPARAVYSGNAYPSKHQPMSKFPHASSPPGKHHHHMEPDSSKTLDSVDSGGGSDAYHAAPAAAILLPKSPPSSHAALSVRIQQRLGHLSKEKHSGADQRLDAVLGGCALVQSHLQRSQDSSEGRDAKERTSQHKGGHHKSQKYLTSSGNAGGGVHDLVSYVSQKRGEKQSDVFDGSIASIQRLVGELKGSVEGFKIRIEVESEGWRGRVEGLEKEIETLKDETDDELLELKKSIKNEVKVRMSELAADVERIRRDEKDQVESLVQDRIDSHLSGSSASMGDLKKEIRTLWAEVENLTKGREDMQNHIERLTKIFEESRESTNWELRTLKREVHGADERSDWKKDAEAERTERAEVRHALEKIKDEGLDMKMEVNCLKKAEKAVKTEMENIRKQVEKMQADTEEMERDRGAAQMEGVRERLLIMERVESLSQLYLGGLEEVRTDVYNVKFSCRDRMDELETQWGDYKRQQENGSEDDHSGLHKQRLLNEMELLRSEIGDMMETERGVLRETLEREHECIRRQLMDISGCNKNDLTCMLKVEVQKRVQAAKDKVMSVADPIKKDMDKLRMDLEDAQHGAEAVARALVTAEKERDMAAQAAAEATVAAERAGEVLADLLGPITQEMAATRRKSLALQDTIALDKDEATQALGDAKRMRLEFQEYMEQEMIRLKTAISLVHKERDSAATAASEASTSAVKAGEVLAEVLGSFNQEVSKARRKSYQLQEGLDRERENLERDREEVIQTSQKSQEKFNEELEKAITTWKRAMNQELVKAKGVTEGLEEDRRRASVSIEQSNGLAMNDQVHIAKIQDVLASLKTTVRQLQDTAENNHQDKQRRRLLKQDIKLRKEQDEKMEISSLRQRIDEAINREEDLRDMASESGKRIKKLEVIHLDLAQAFQEIRSTTGDLEKTAAIWLPKYENAARIVNEINFKVESLEERCKGINADEGLMQQMAHVAESKIQSLKEMVGAGTELKDLFQKVESGDLEQRQALSMLETRVNQLETSVGPEVRGLSLKLEYIEKKTDGGGGIPQTMVGLTQNVDILQRKVEMLAEQRQHVEEQESNLDLSNKINGLESRIELVASATFTNLRLLDSKVEECTTSVHRALEGAATAENKCSALGTELVKVFRMLASSRQASPAVPPRTRSPPSCGRDHSPTKTNPADRTPSPPRTRSPLNRRLQTPRPAVRKPQLKSQTGDFARSTMASEMRKVTPRGEADLQEEYLLAGASSPVRERITGRDRSPARERIPGGDHDTKALTVHQHLPSGKGVQDFMTERTTSLQEGEIKGLGRLTISQDQADDKQKDGTNKCQRTNIRLEAGRIHVNVSHRSGVSTGNRDKRADLVAVQT